MDQQRRLLQDINNYMVRNRDLIRKREEEAEQERIRQEEESKVKAQLEEEEKLREEAEVKILEEEVEKVQDAVTNEEIEGAVRKEEDKEAAEAEEEAEEAKEDVPEISETHRQTERLKLKLKLPVTSRTQTLESPAFVREADMYFAVPPTEQELVSQAAAQAAATANQEIPMEFPPSPMVTKALIGTIPENPDSPDSGSCSLSLSPNSRRKFVISRVEEKESGVKWGSHAAAAASEAAILSRDKVEASNGAQGDKCNGATEAEGEVGNVTDYVSNIVHTAVDQHHKDLACKPRDDAAHAAQAECDSVNKENSPAGHGGVDDFVPCIESLECDSNSTHVGPECGSNSTPVGPKSGSNSTSIGPENVDIQFSQRCKPKSMQKKDLLGAGDKQAPDFHTSLSMNGMKTELATVLDSLEQNKESQPFPLLSMPGGTTIPNLDTGMFDPGLGLRLQ